MAGEVSDTPKGVPVAVETSGRNALAVVALRNLSVLEKHTEISVLGDSGVAVTLTPDHGWSGMGSGSQHLWRVLASLCEPEHPVDLFVALAHLDAGNRYAVAAALSVMAGANHV
jgi:hypothetical protein